MKKLIYIAIVSLAIISCKKESNDFVTFSGTITNKNSDSLVISNPQLRFKRVIKLDENGAFKDTMKVKDGFYRAFDGKEYATLYLMNGADINMTLDAKEFDETIAFTGAGNAENNFLAKSGLLQEEFFSDQSLLDLPKEEFDKKMNSYVDNFKTRLTTTAMDSAFTKGQESNIQRMQQFYTKMHGDRLYLNTKLAKGLDSPKFVDYENYKGGTTSLDDLKGKYVYIDMWATWCNPCKREIPFLQKVEKQYHGKNIEFVSISVDSEKDHDTWKKMVADKELTGIQLYSKRDKVFSGAYRVNSIPRFILIDPQGKIVDANAPRPSDPKLIELFTSLNI